MATITLNSMEFHAYHGCLKHERKYGNTFIVTVGMTLDTAKAGASDRLADTLDYQAVYDTVKAEMEQPSRLLEHVAQRILDALNQRFPQVEHFTVRLSKQNPPLGGKVADATIEVSGGAKPQPADEQPINFF